MPAEYYIGLISGTSLDGIDAALVEFTGGRPRGVAFHYQPYAIDLRQRLRALSQAGAHIALAEYGALDAELGELFAAAALELLRQAGVSASEVNAIGSHGQTVYHQPQAPHAFTLQIADPNRIAQFTGITTVADFRRRDMAAGGQGAPLAPAFHHAVFAAPGHIRLIANIGGIANLTVLNGETIIGFDTGPGNTLLDYWRREWDGAAYDAGGAWAASGRAEPALVQAMLADPYFALPPPKSTGPEYFSPAWLRRHLQDFPSLAAADVQASLLQLTAQSLARAALAYAGEETQIIVCGGGAHNHVLMRELAAHSGLPVASSADYGVHPDQVEAFAFAWLARQTLNRQPGNLPAVTGANAPVVLGGVYPA